MPKVKILPKLLSMKIAAGEVVERPASVVKELIENSIDAGATRIAVTIEEGGRRLVRVVDDGTGLSREDAATAVLRHATSKVATEEDLGAIETMGFRGEALPSIASVSRLTIKTKERGEVAGTEVTVEGGSDAEVSDAGCAEGTIVEVKDLFYNTPARAKFLRTAQTEYGRILDIFKRLAVANPHIGMSLVHDKGGHGKGRPLELAAGTLAERVRAVFGADTAGGLREISFEGGGAKATGFAGDPASCYPTTKYLYTYLNGRYIRDRSINKAVQEGYRGTMEGGRYPFVVIDLKVPFGEVDINVHPAKTEVRFRRPSFAFDIVRAAVMGAVRQGGIPFDRNGGERAESQVASEPSHERLPFGARLYKNSDINSDKNSDGSSAGSSGGRPLKREAAESHTPYRGTATVVPRSSQVAPLAAGSAEETAGAVSREVVNPEYLELEFVGQLFGEYIIAERPGAGEYYLIDQHGAAERCRFETLKRAYGDGERVASQYMLVPERIETTPEERGIIISADDTLRRLGFELEPFGPSVREGGETFIIKAAPHIIGGRAAGRLVKELAEEIAANGGSSRIESAIDDVLMTIACHSVIRGPRRLSPDEAKALFDDLARTDLAGHCPHGRPVVKRYTRDALEIAFKRK